MSSGIIAYKSDSIALEKAVWDTIWGMWVEFRLEQKPDQLKAANPFKKFTKRRKDKTGTRFGAVFNYADGSTAYENEVMLKGWGDGTSGWKASFYVQADESGFHPFMGCEKGDLLTVVMVELDDDNEAIDQVKRDRLEAAQQGRATPRLSNYAAQLCRNERFVRYIGDRCGEQPSSPEHAAEFAAEWMRKLLKIGSRRDLDTDQEAATRFHKHIREPYQKWYRERFE